MITRNRFGGRFDRPELETLALALARAHTVDRTIRTRLRDEVEQALADEMEQERLDTEELMQPGQR